MIISPGRRYIFVHIPKTGGTSLALALEARAKADDILIGDTPKARRRRQRLKRLQPPGRLWKHSRLSDIDGMPGLPDDAMIFTLVRNPWDRLVSLYHWARDQGFDHPMIHAAKALEFEAFLQDAAVQRALRNDGAEAYVTDRSGSIRCNTFVRLEHLSADLAPVEAHLGFAIEMPHANRSQHPPPRELYSDRACALVADIFADDIARFGYDFPA
jgi:hypothetical protein